MSKKKKTLIAVFAILAITVVGLSVGVIAKYVATLTSSTGSARVAKWAFESDNSSAALVCDITDKANINTDTLVADRIAPGTTGTCEIELSNENSEVGVTFTITASSVTGKPTNLTLNYVDSGDSANTGTLAQNTAITGTMVPGETGRKITVNWAWPYNNTDANNLIDSADGVAAGQMGITFNVSGEQIQPAYN